MKFFLLIMLFFVSNSFSQHPLDKVLDSKKTPQRIEGKIDDSVMLDIDMADHDLKNRLNEVSKTFSNIGEFDKKYSEGKKCKLDCYRIIKTTNKSITVKCLVGVKAGSEEVIGLPNRHDSLDKAVRFYCNQ